ncbi:hypothetical protein ACOQFV_31170 [Nocardiopsis changdeensis]|uniref:Uncharacterized protein n=1 Tax=Nocardiopsis changdeensis TaxID=2831969 RepID=A0ABX8BTM3_9ACTN|nr:MULTISPECIES: hypothetical protein [Nocardiopsis]QUX25045.1 hypothetical protein KGD84_12730 [Nocardiopsis changdeensis]QYX35431.1 hypothetical protein K1J57_22180 [Nocardiopsis sp. MT53]
MNELRPEARTMLSLLLMLNRTDHSAAWVAISLHHPHYDLAQFLRPLVEHTLEGRPGPTRALAQEISEAFSDLDEVALATIGDALTGNKGGTHPQVGRIWVHELLTAALHVEHALLSETLEQRFAQW